MDTQKIQNSGLTINTDICNSSDYDQDRLQTPNILYLLYMIQVFQMKE